MSNRPGDSEEEDESTEDDEAASKPGVVYRLNKGVLKKLEGGMVRYEELAAKTSAKMVKV